MYVRPVFSISYSAFNFNFQISSGVLNDQKEKKEN